MTIKKPVKKTTTTQAAKPAEGATEATQATAAAGGGAAIADRFKLDAPDPAAAKKAAAATKGTKYAVIAGVIALIVAGVLTYILYQHWEFLMPA